MISKSERNNIDVSNIPYKMLNLNDKFKIKPLHTKNDYPDLSKIDTSVEEFKKYFKISWGSDHFLKLLMALLDNGYVGYNETEKKKLETREIHLTYSLLIEIGKEVFRKTNDDKDKLSLIQMKVKADIFSYLEDLLIQVNKEIEKNKIQEMLEIRNKSWQNII